MGEEIEEGKEQEERLEGRPSTPEVSSELGKKSILFRVKTANVELGTFGQGELDEV